jgi:HAD superfamily phosphoserine phosphatase-like hydrolase
MSEMHESIPVPEDLTVANYDKFHSKATLFASMGAESIHAVFDFDRTLTVKMPGSQVDVTTWHILQEHLPQEGKLRYQELFEKYRALEISGSMTQEDAVEWWSGILHLFTENNIDLNAVEETFLECASIRPGTPELFALLESKGIPTIILSAGIRDVIEIWCRKYDVKPTLVISTALILDDVNRITGWREDTLVHVLSKSEANHSELTLIRNQRPNAILVGDSLDDASMASGGHNVFRCRIIDPRSDEVDTEKEDRMTLMKFDAYIKSGSLQPLENFVELIT